MSGYALRRLVKRGCVAKAALKVVKQYVFTLRKLCLFGNFCLVLAVSPVLFSSKRAAVHYREVIAELQSGFQARLRVNRPVNVAAGGQGVLCVMMGVCRRTTEYVRR